MLLLQNELYIGLLNAVVPSKFVELLSDKKIFLILAFELELFHNDELFVGVSIALDIIECRDDVALVGIFVVTWELVYILLRNCCFCNLLFFMEGSVR